ncbi:hypothetical protein ACK3BE_32685 (plasmid) [Pseudomonas mandelii]|uniref:hypothetical protein n=1 Tax=Pseudomonas mandelii TaxID=75612 RepID=UPI00398CCE12
MPLYTNGYGLSFWIVLILMCVGIFAAFRSGIATIKYASSKHDPEQAERWQSIAAHAQRDGSLNERETRTIAESFYTCHRNAAVKWLVATVVSLSLAMVLAIA